MPPRSTHNWIPYFLKLKGTYSSDNNSPDFHRKNTNISSNSSSEFVLSKIFMPRLKIPYRSKVIVETVTESHLSTHFLCDYISWI